MGAQSSKESLASVLEWHIDQGCAEVLEDTPQDRTIMKKPENPKPENLKPENPVPKKDAAHPQKKTEAKPLLGTQDYKSMAFDLAQKAQTLEDLKQAIQDFEGLSIKKTATNMVFCDGNPEADVMLVGEAPGADEDEQGKPFVGLSGQLLDMVLASIGLSRKHEDPKTSLYISNIINWRPPGNRTPSPQEIAISLPFIEKHIALIKPKVLILCGGVSAKSLLNRNDGISKFRGRFNDYLPVNEGIAEGIQPIPSLSTYHPAYLLRSPGQKKLVWQDMILLKKHLETL